MNKVICLPTDKDPIPGRVKFFNESKQFGFISTADSDFHFTKRGYRRIRGLGDGKVAIEFADCPPIQDGIEVLLLEARCAPKGVQALQWTIPSFNTERLVLYVVIQRIERRTEKSHSSDPVCDNERRMFKTETVRTIETFINERIVFTSASREDAERHIEGALSSRLEESRNGVGTVVTNRIESVEIA